MSNGTQISDMTPVAVDDAPEGAAVPFVVETSGGGFNSAVNYRTDVIAGINARVRTADLSADTGAELVGTTDGNVQTDLEARPTSALLASATGSANIGFQQQGTGSAVRTIEARDRDVLYATDFTGVDPTGVADSLAGLNAANNAAIAQRKALVLTHGTYKVSGTWNALTGSNQHIIAQGDVTIECTGSGTGVYLGQMGALTAIYGCTFGGGSPIRVSGNASTTDAIISRGVCGSSINVNARNCTQSALRMIWNVRNSVELRCIPSGDPAFTTVPSYGLLLETEGSGYYCSANDLYVWASGVSSAGIFGNEDGASFNNVHGGACESSNRGLVWSVGCNRNNVFGLDVETNVENDVTDDGYCNSYFGIRASSPTTGATIEMGGQGASFTGCSIRLIDLASSSHATSFFGCGFDEGPSVGIQGSGPYKSVGCYTFDNDFAFTANVPDVVGQTGSFTPTVTQGSLVASTSTASYTLIGDSLIVMGSCSITAAGSAADIIVGGIPAALAPENFGARTVMGTFFAVDNGTAAYTGIVARETDSTFTLRKSDGGALNFTLASGDTINFTLNYKVA